ncbi:MAG: hypothetical protein F6K08_02460 [Okeania sp. SIO1H6]|nr:hypothetical protein [Okeania hirsuta]NET11780.1 hypothetical protein [Okeania sp. SIO1H6]
MGEGRRQETGDRRNGNQRGGRSKNCQFGIFLHFGGGKAEGRKQKVEGKEKFKGSYIMSG